MSKTNLHPIFAQALAPFLSATRECDCEDVEHDTDCREHPEYDPTPWCGGCGARRKSDCHCGPLAEND